MAKKQKYESIAEAVGDTSGFDESKAVIDKGRKIKIYASLGGIVLLFIFACIFFTTPIKAEFKYQDGANQTARYEISRKTGLLSSAPSDPTRAYYTFEGWYLNESLTNGPYYNNENNHSLLEQNYSTSGNVTFYAKWLPVYYNITYNLKGNINNISDASLKKIINDNITTYTIKHTVTAIERSTYVEYLRESDPDTYVKSANATKNLNIALELYENNCQLASRKLNEPILSGYTFVGWYSDSNFENEVTELSQLSPEDITLYAKWEKN